MKQNTSAVVLLSGGIDSATCLALAVAKWGSENVAALNVFYGQRHEREIESAKKIAAHYGVSCFELDMSCVLEYSDCSLLKHSSKDITHKSYGEQLREKGVVDTYVPFRNGLLLSAAATFAISKGADVVIYGAHADDAAGSAYPDCSELFVKCMGKAIAAGSGGKVKLAAPFVRQNKAAVVGLGLQLKVPYMLTWSCYEGGDKPCGKCAACIDRNKAFAVNGSKDPAMGDERR